MYAIIVWRLDYHWFADTLVPRIMGKANTSNFEVWQLKHILTDDHYLNVCTIWMRNMFRNRWLWAMVGQKKQGRETKCSETFSGFQWRCNEKSQYICCLTSPQKAKNHERHSWNIYYLMQYIFQERHIKCTGSSWNSHPRRKSDLFLCTNTNIIFLKSLLD